MKLRDATIGVFIGLLVNGLILYAADQKYVRPETFVDSVGVPQLNQLVDDIYDQLNDVRRIVDSMRTTTANDTLVQWGTGLIIASATIDTVVLPIAFEDSTYGIAVTHDSTAASAFYVSKITDSSFTITQGTTAVVDHPFHWIAVGKR